MMRILNSRSIWSSLALVCIALVIASIIMTAVLKLHPCHLCILQRLLFMLLAAFALLAAIFARNLFGRLMGVLELAVAAGGISVATYQLWLQAHADKFSCTSGTPLWVETLIDWLGNKVPSVFMATGLCQEVELRILSLSLAGWALIAFSAALIAGGIALAVRRR